MAKDNVVSFKEMYIRTAHLSNPEGSDPTITMQCTAKLDDKLKERMGWFQPKKGEDGAGEDQNPDIVEIVTAIVRTTSDKVGLRGSLAGETFQLVPSAQAMKKYALDISIKSVDSFEMVITNDKEGEAADSELRFRIESRQKGVLGQIEKYIGYMGRGKATGKVTYARQMALGEAVDMTGDDDQMELDQNSAE